MLGIVRGVYENHILSFRWKSKDVLVWMIPTKSLGIFFITIWWEENLYNDTRSVGEVRKGWESDNDT